MLRVHYFQRRRRPNANFSLEFIFDDVRKRLRSEVDARVVTAPCYSNGFSRRVAIAAHAAVQQGEINHITGDITFVAIPLRKERTVLTMLDCGSVLHARGLKRLLLQKVWLELPVAGSAVVTTISQQAKAEIVALTGCDPAKVIVIPVAISQQFQFTPREFNQERPRILALGTAPNKNLERLIAAIDGLACTLVIIGQLPQEHRDALVQRQIQFENYYNLSSEAVIEQYHRSDLVSFVSTYEGFGMPILEAQAVGRPVITSNLSSMPEVAGDAACLVNPLDVASIRSGLLRVIEDAPYREQLVVRGRENVKRFDPERIARQYLEVYQKLAS